jgi:hypothetical protein
MNNKNQLAILYVYTLYTSEKTNDYLQYTAALVIFYYLMQKGYFPDYNEQLLIYDYKDSRRFMWEDKTFMNDINVVRSFDYLNRARVRSSEFRDMNAHQCTQKGELYINQLQYADSPEGKKIAQALHCKCGKLLQVALNDDMPRLVCQGCKQKTEVQGFLKDLDTTINHEFDAAFL